MTHAYHTTNAIKTQLSAYRRILLIILASLAFNGMARAQGTSYDGPTTLIDITKFGFGGGSNYTAYPHDTRLWIPNDVAIIRGVIIIPNGVDGDARGIVTNTFWQALARMYGFALMGTRGYVCYGNGTTSVDTEVPVLLSDFAGYATASGHPEVANLPMIITGWSACGQVAYGINTKIPERVITFITNKGGYYIQPPLVAAALKTPTLGVAGQLDSAAGRTAIKNNFEIHRPLGAIWAKAFEENVGHNMGNVDGVWYTFFDHAIRARLPAGAPPLTGPVTLLDLPENSGWLAAAPTDSGGLSGRVYPYADYPGTKTSACWLMDADVANLYRGFATWGPAVTVTVVGGPIFAAGQTIQFNVSVDSALFTDWVSADVYDGAVKLGTVTNGGATSVSAVRPWGARGVTAIARNAAGNERTSIPKPFVVRNAVALANTAATEAQRTSANLNATFCPAWGNYTVTAYWGTNNGGSNATAWQNSMEVGTWTGGDATNVSYTATGLSEQTDYYFTFRATSTVTGSTVWATNVISFRTVTPNAPTSSGAALTALEDTPTALAAGNFGYTDQPGVALAAVQITSLPALGTLENGGVTVVNGGLPLTVTAANIGNLTYQSALNGNGTSYATMGIKVMNAGGLWSAGATMTLNVTPVNDAPTSTGGSVNLNGNPLRTFSAGDFPFADVDAGDTLGAIKVTSLPATGTLKLNDTAITSVPSAFIPLANIRTLTYTAGTGYSGSDSFKFQVRDADLFSADATMTITGSSTFAVLTSGNPANSTTDFLTNTTEEITNTVTAAALNSLSIDTTAGSNSWDITNGKTATVTTGGLSMTGANNFTIKNGTLKSASSGFFVNPNGAGTLTLGSVIANGLGASTFTKAGTGALTLSGENTYSGATTISGGILNLTHALALKNSALDTTNSVVGSATAGLKTDRTTLTLGGLTGDKDLAEVFTTALGGTAGTTALGGYSGVTALTLNPGLGIINTYAGIISNGASSMSVTKNGLGTQTLSGDHTLNNVTINAGTLGITGGSLSLANGFVQVGSAVPGIFKIDGGSLNVSSTGNNTGGLKAGNAAGNLGAIHLNSGAITTTALGFNLHIGGVGTNIPTYGFLNITGGTLSGAQQRTRIGQFSGTGVWYQSGGTYSNSLSSASIEVGSVGAATDFNIGVVYLNNNAQFTSNTAINIAPTNIGIATLTVAGNAALTVNNTLTAGAASGTTAIVNLNGGTLTVRAITNNATGTCNFNGGTLKAGLAGALFSGTGSAYVYPGGLTIDTNGNAVTISQALRVPSGNGVATIPVTSPGSGYIGAPYVALSGNGTGATAVANMVDDGSGSGTYKVDSITITCPGRDYTAITGATLSGGLPSGGTAAVLNFDNETFAPNAGGGLTKIGSGTLTLSGSNTYTGDTTVSSGVLAINGSSIPDAGKLVISGGKVDLTHPTNAETVGTLFFGTTQQAAGTYSATGTNGTIASTNFTGTGTLIVTSGPPSSTPTITTSDMLSALSTTFGKPSNPTTFTVAGANMRAGILVTAPTHFEVSQLSGSGYGSTTTVGSAGTISATPVYLRLAATAPVGTYNSQNIVLSSTGANAVNVTTAASNNIVSAPPPDITLTGTLGAVNTTYGTVLATPTSFHVAASHLTPASGDLTVTPPPGYEVSLSSSSGYSTRLLVPYSGSTLASTPVYARLAATAGVGSSPYSGNITVAGGGASSETIATVSSAVAKAVPTATLAVSNSPVIYDGTAKSATVNITTSSVPGSVRMVLTGAATTKTAAGNYAVTANFVPDDNTNYNTLSELPAGNFSIGKATPTVTITGTLSFTYNGSAQGPATAHVTGSTGTVTYNYVGTAGTTYSAIATRPTNAGSYTVTATVEEGINYNSASSTPTAFSIGKANPTAMLAVSNSSVPYDGTAKSANVNITTSSVPGSVHSILTGRATTQTAAGIYAVTANFVPDDSTNYNTLSELAAGTFAIGGTTIPVINRSFETEYGSHTDKTTNWVKLNTWSLESPPIGSVPIDGAFSSPADDGSKFTRFTFNDGGVEQNLKTTVSAGATLSVTFNLGVRLNPSWVISGANVKGNAYFLVGGTYYKMPYDLTGRAAGVWYPFTFTTTITNSGNLSIGFQNLNVNNTYYTSLDGVSDVIAIPAVVSYAAWAATNSVTGGISDDSNHDGVSNGIAYFMGLTGSASMPGPGTGRKVTWTNGGNIPSSAYGSKFVVQTSTDLVTWTPVAGVDPNLSNTAGSVSYTLPPSAGKLFVRLVVTPN